VGRLCPRLDESAGKRRSVRVRKGGRWLKTALVQAAWAAIKVKDSYLQAQYVWLKARRGPKKAIVAVAASMLVAAHHILRDGTDYRDLGGAHFDRRAKRRVALASCAGSVSSATRWRFAPPYSRSVMGFVPARLCFP